MTIRSLELTFFVIGDTRFGYNQKFIGDDCRGEIISQINDLPGWIFPDRIGGVVDRPSFVYHCGNLISGHGTTDLHYYRYFAEFLKYPLYEGYGNKDSPCIDYFVQKYGSTSYSFVCDGIHFISLDSWHKNKKRFAQSVIEFLDRDLSNSRAENPIIVFSYNRVDDTENGEKILNCLADQKVLLMISCDEHVPNILHREIVYRIRDIPCIQVGHAHFHPTEPEYSRNFHVIRIQDGKLISLPWRWDLKNWENGQNWTDAEAAAKRHILIDYFSRI